MSIYQKTDRKGAQRRFKTRDWRTLCEEVDPRPAKEVSYEFSNSRKFTESFNPTNGPYEPQE